jgi:predicted nucleic acid-binding protein
VIALDTNLLVYAHRSRAPEHWASRAVIEQAIVSSLGWGVAAPVISEFWSVVTHPKVPGRPSTPHEAARFVEFLIGQGARLWDPGADFSRRLIRTALNLGLAGPRVFDLQISLAARDNGATEIWTNDSGFAAVPGMQVRHFALA